MYQRVFRYISPHRNDIALAFFQLVLIQLCQLLKPWPLKITIDYILGSPASALMHTFSFHTALFLVCVSLVLIYVVLGGLVLWSNYTTLSIGNRVMNSFRSDLYGHIQKMSLKFHAERNIGDLLYRLTADTSAIQVLAIRGLFPLLSALVLLCGIFAVMLHIDFQLSFVVIAVCPLLLYAISFLNRKINLAAADVRDRESRIFTLLNTALPAMKVVQAFSKEPAEHEKFMQASRESLDAGLRLNSVETMHAWVVNSLIALGTAFVIWFGTSHALTGLLTVGDLYVFISYVTALYGPVNSVTQSWGLLYEAKAGMDRVFAVLDIDSDLTDGQMQFHTKGARGEIAFEKVRFGYVPGRLVLDAIDLHIGAGEKIVVVGPSGGGKSTLLSLISRFYDPVSGTVAIDGEDLRQYRLESLRGQIASVFQTPLVFPLSVRDNISYGRPDAPLEDIRSAARRACIHDVIENLPAGYETLIGEGGQTLSEGEKQRITIARALLCNAPIEIFDEPISAVDSKTEMNIISNLMNDRPSRTVIMTTHRLASARHAEHIIVIHGGRIAEEGSFDDLLAAGGVFSEIYDIQENMPDLAVCDTGTASLLP
ncbi:MAG: ABC transporter ATP-binding protein [Chlorobiaceae bacterium]|nr:ABC transporter ATP-binding protein [Chlorobiaceae bacterium]